MYEEKLRPLEDNLYTIGYPAGLFWTNDDKTKSLEPSIRDTKCSKEPNKYYFEFQANSVAGSSGSPVYNKKGQLTGILFGGYSIAGGATKAVHAKFLKKLYDEEGVYVLNQWGRKWGANGYAIMNWNLYLQSLMYGAYLCD